MPVLLYFSMFDDFKPRFKFHEPDQIFKMIITVITIIFYLLGIASCAWLVHKSVSDDMQTYKVDVASVMTRAVGPVNARYESWTK